MVQFQQDNVLRFSAQEVKRRRGTKEVEGLFGHSLDLLGDYSVLGIIVENLYACEGVVGEG